MSEKLTKSLSLRVSEEDLQRLDQLVQIMRRKRGDVIRILIEDACKEMEK